MDADEYTWLEFVREDNPFWNAVRGNLVGFMAFDPVQEKAQNLGAGFIVGRAFDAPGVGNNFLMVLTAKHVLEDAYKFQDTQKHAKRAANAPSVLFNDQLSIDDDKLRAIWMGTSTGDMMRVRHVTFANNLDIAMCILEPQDAARQSAMVEAPGILFDVTMPPIGETVHIVSLTDYSTQGESIAAGNVITLKNRPFIRRGKVTAHETSAMGHNGPCFRVSCPTVGGMSGGFVCVPGPDGSPIGACGIISSSQEVENPNHFSTQGETLIVSIAGALGLDLPFQKAPTSKIRILDLIRDGHIEDVRKPPHCFSMIEFEHGQVITRIEKN